MGSVDSDVFYNFYDQNSKESPFFIQGIWGKCDAWIGKYTTYTCFDGFIQSFGL